MNVEIENEAAQFHFLGIYVSNFRYSVCFSLMFTKNADKTQKSFEFEFTEKVARKYNPKKMEDKKLLQHF
jgi:hypothetical protein